jgi:hypothetical protein
MAPTITLIATGLHIIIRGTVPNILPPMVMSIRSDIVLGQDKARERYFGIN